MTPENQERLNSRVKRVLNLQDQLRGLLTDASRKIDALRKDADAGCLPRYHGHLRQTVDSINDLCIKMEACNLWE